LIAESLTTNLFTRIYRRISMFMFFAWMCACAKNRGQNKCEYRHVCYGFWWQKVVERRIKNSSRHNFKS